MLGRGAGTAGFIELCTFIGADCTEADIVGAVADGRGE